MSDILNGSERMPRAHVSRRRLLQLGAVGAGSLAFGGAGAGLGHVLAAPTAPAGDAALAAKWTIDLSDEPPTLDPALNYQIDGWSIVHAIYDSLVQYGPDGKLQPLLAESYRLVDPTTYEFTLRSGITFHNGEPLTAASVAVSVAHIMNKDVASQVAQLFAVIKQVEQVDSLTVRMHLTEPAPWLLSQIAAYLALLPPKYAANAKNDLGSHPIGTGPYRFVSWQRGESITLAANDDYFAASPKGRPLAKQVVYRAVPDLSTQVADLLSGTAQLIRAVPIDRIDQVKEAGDQVIAKPVSGSAWIRVANDVAPFIDARVRQALNYAVDVDAIVKALLAGHGQRLANFFPPDGLGYDPNLKPYPYDPDKAKQLLKEAGVPKNFAVELDFSTTERPEVVEAVAGQLSEAGLKVKAQPQDVARFNQTWQDPKTAPLRYSTWRPMFDPYSLLSLVVANKGYLSRYKNDKAQALIDAGAKETDAAKRAQIYQQLGQVLHDDPAAIYLYSVTALYGAQAGVSWTQRADDYIIATKV